ncbi:unnamed protein product [Schistosoma haematobium]|nr:unnamed protein product [Schistosoma haematobium]
MEIERKNHDQTNFTSDLRLLDYQSKKFYKNSFQLLSKLSLHHKEIKSILEYSQDLKSVLLTDGKKYHQKLFKFRTLVELFSSKKSQIVNKQLNHGNCVKELQNLLKSIEEILTEYKTEERMIAEALLQQEVELWQDCLNMEHRISVWENDSKWPDKINSKIQNREHSINSLTRLSIGSKNLPAEVNEFQNFLDNHGGRTGGWTEDEHLKFLKYYKIKKFKYKNDCKDPENEESNNPDHDHPHEEEEENELSTLTIDHHEQQTIKDENLDKINKDNTNVNMNVLHDELANIIMTKTPKEIAEHEKWWKEFQKFENAKRKAIKIWSENRRLNIQNRKQCKEKNDDNDSDDDAMGKNHQSHIKQHLSISQLEARKAELEQWRNQREEIKKQEELLKKKIENQSKQAELELKRKRQTINQLNQLSARKKAKEQSEIPRQELLERIPIQTNIQVTRDPQRLCQLTKGWEIRLTQPKTQTIIHQGLNLSVNTGRMIPQWRRNL